MQHVNAWCPSPQHTLHMYLAIHLQHVALSSDSEYYEAKRLYHGTRHLKYHVHYMLLEHDIISLAHLPK